MARFNAVKWGDFRNKNFSFILDLDPVKPTKKKLFFFIDSDGKKVYPEGQTPGDFIVFPSWAEHGVDPSDESADEQRVVIAGNISVTMVNRLHAETENYHKVSKTVDVIERS